MLRNLGKANSRQEQTLNKAAMSIAATMHWVKCWSGQTHSGSATEFSEMRSKSAMPWTTAWALGSERDPNAKTHCLGHQFFSLEFFQNVLFKKCSSGWEISCSISTTLDSGALLGINPQINPTIWKCKLFPLPRS